MRGRDRKNEYARHLFASNAYIIYAILKCRRMHGFKEVLRIYGTVYAE